MRLAVIGAGRMGTAAAMDLIAREGVAAVTLVDEHIGPAQAAAGRVGSGATGVAVDVRAPGELERVLAGHGAAVSAVPYHLAPHVAHAGIETGCHVVDLGGSPKATATLLALDDRAAAADVALVPDVGLAPGLTNFLAYAAAAEVGAGCDVRIRVGGLPQHPTPPLGYRCVFSAHGLLNEYLGQADVIRDGAATTAPALSELEEDDYPELGRLEAFLTVGGLSTLAETLAGRVRSLDEKTLRYPGHRDQIQLLLDCGLGSEEPVAVGALHITPRSVLEATLERTLPDDGADLVVARVEAEAADDAATPRRVRYTMLDRADPASGLSAMQRTTAFPAAAVAYALATGSFTFRGAKPGETWIPVDALVADLANRGVAVGCERS